MSLSNLLNQTLTPTNTVAGYDLTCNSLSCNTLNCQALNIGTTRIEAGYFEAIIGGADYIIAGDHSYNILPFNQVTNIDPHISLNPVTGEVTVLQDGFYIITTEIYFGAQVPIPGNQDRFSLIFVSARYGQVQNYNTVAGSDGYCNNNSVGIRLLSGQSFTVRAQANNGCPINGSTTSRVTKLSVVRISLPDA